MDVHSLLLKLVEKITVIVYVYQMLIRQLALL